MNNNNFKFEILSYIKVKRSRKKKRFDFYFSLKRKQSIAYENRALTCNVHFLSFKTSISDKGRFVMVELDVFL